MVGGLRQPAVTASPSPPSAAAGAYPILAGRRRTETEVRRSVFICTVEVAATVEAAREFIKEIRSEIPGASHHVYAFAVGHGSTVTCGMGDDGEPTGTAGPPSLAAVQASGLGDVCLVTSRIFGGTKLGTGGLVRAYADAARTALDGAPTTWHRTWIPLHIEVPHAQYDTAMRVLRAEGARIDGRHFGQFVQVEVSVDAGAVAQIRAQLADASGGHVRVEVFSED